MRGVWVALSLDGDPLCSDASFGSDTLTGVCFLRGGFGPPSERRMGEPRVGKSSLCALPTTAFLLTPSLRPISAVEWPSSHSARSRATVSSDHPA
jgi:hypothetical protein